MSKKKRILIITIAAVLTVITVGSVLLATLPRSSEEKPEETSDNIELTVDELFVKELLDGSNIDDLVGDPDWKENVVDSTENYVMVDADKFDFSKEIGIEDGYTNIYFSEESREIELLQHNYVTYTNDLDPKQEIETLVGNVQGNITALLGNPSEAFMLMNTSGEFIDYDGLSIDEMIEKVLEGGHVMYVMYECNGLRYEMNIMFSDDTVYSIVWIYNETSVCGDDCEH